MVSAVVSAVRSVFRSAKYNSDFNSSKSNLRVNIQRKGSLHIEAIKLRLRQSVHLHKKYYHNRNVKSFSVFMVDK